MIALCRKVGAQSLPNVWKRANSAERLSRDPENKLRVAAGIAGIIILVVHWKNGEIIEEKLFYDLVGC
jgi:uncharacterized protein YjeT (DUF2065 family)